MIVPELHIQEFEELDSTQAELHRRLELQDLPHGTTIVASRQTGGRGRLGRQWLDTGKTAMWSTFVAPGLSADQIHLVSLAAGLALEQVLADHLQIHLKWPNDILDSRLKKLAGILCEGIWQGDQPAGVIVGTGVNIRWPAEGPPAEIAESATCLADHVANPDLPASTLIHDWWIQLNHELALIRGGNMEDFVQRYNRALHPTARICSVQGVETPKFTGYIEGINHLGQLKLRQQDGRVVLIGAGELILQDQPIVSGDKQ